MSVPYAIDFETYYDSKYSLKNMSVTEYVNHPQFDAYIVSIYGPDIQFVGPPRDAPWDKLDRQTWLMHNAGFDLAVVFRLQELGVIPKVTAEAVYDTADLAAYCGTQRNLKDAAWYLLGERADKTVRDRMKGNTELSEENKTYALQDARLTYLLWTTQSYRWPEHERLVSHLNLAAGFKGLRIDVPALTTAIATLETQRHEAGLLLPWLDTEDPDKPLSREAFYRQCRESGIPDAPASLAMNDEKCQEWFDRNAEQYPWIKARRDWGRINMLLQKLYTLRGMIQPGTDRAVYNLKYFGAGTGRFSGGGKFNVQNLPKEELFGVNLRHMILPDPGTRMVIVDLAQIEARLLLWAAGDTKTLDIVRAGHHLYEAHARATMGWTGGKLKEEDKKLYNLAKARVLGGGYGAGAATFRKVAKVMAGLDLSAEESEETIRAYRANNPAVVAFWGKLHRYMQAAAYSSKKKAAIQLPSGRALTYHAIGLDGKNVVGTLFRGKAPTKLFGGKLTENYIQALARDLLVYLWLSMHKAGIEVRLTVHDEFMTMSRNPENTLDLMMTLVRTDIPEWLKGCPIDCEGFIADCYTK